MLSRVMRSCANRTARVTALAYLLGLAGCGPSIEESAETPAADGLTTTYVEMIEPFTGMDLQRDAPERPADLVVKELAKGSGEAIHYGMIGRFQVIGSLANGEIFQNTFKGDGSEPTVARLLPPAVTEGFALGVDGCKVGERRLIKVPSRLGYGDRADFSHEAMIPAHSALVYDVELVEVVRDLAIKILVEGTGEELRHGKTGRFHYTGVLAEDGRMFDASPPGQARPFAVGPGVIQGWALGLPGMKVGEKRRLRVPSDLAYGEAGVTTRPGQPPSIIGPDADLVFDVELIEIMP